MVIKICGMKYAENIAQMVALQPNMLGFIFYAKSARYVGQNFTMPVLPSHIKTVGVFVNESIDTVVHLYKKHQLNYVQLHGHEDEVYCQQLHQQNIKILKAFSVDDNFNFATLKDYLPYVDYFLFDTKGKLPGGNGEAFNWDILKNYTMPKPFLLSGGVGVQNIQEALHIKHKSLAGFDINSKIEEEPAVKNINLATTIINTIKQYN